MKTIFVIFVSEDWVAHATREGERRLPACGVRQLAEHSFADAKEIRSEPRITVGQGARQDRLAACAPHFPFRTWFIDNPRPQLPK